MEKRIGNIILLGTSHVSEESSKKIKEIISKELPEVVAIELDFNRLRKVLSTSEKDQKKESSIKLIREYGITGYLFLIIGSFVQRKVAKDLGIEPGIDMKTAYNEARKNKIPSALIDRDIRIVLKEMSAIPFSKKFSMFGSLLFKGFKKEYREELSFDPKTVPDEELIKKALEIMRKELPEFYKILIDSRNEHMSDRLLDLSSKHEGDILAVVGAGHIEGMYEILSRKFIDNKSELSFSFKTEY